MENYPRPPMRNMKKALLFLCVLLVIGSSQVAQAQQTGDINVSANIDEQVQKLMRKGKIPGLSLVIIKDGQQVTRNYGYANVQDQKQVTANTLFQLGSCSKAFTALAFLRLANDSNINLATSVADYIPWFRPKYKDSLVKVTLLQVLHHTSGIPWQTIGRIPTGNVPNALENTIQQIAGVQLRHLPGKKYEYATINYDILALVIQKVSHMPFEEYVRLNVLEKLQLFNTGIGQPVDSNWMATGYKISFFKPREFDAPVYRGNNAAGYFISNARDMGRWLQFQMGLLPSELSKLANVTHQRDETVPPHGMDSYGMGWEVSLRGDGQIVHGGLNPNFTAFIGFRPGKKIGLAVLANSNSEYTAAIGNRVIKLMAGEEIVKEPDPGDSGDAIFSVITCMLAFYCLVVLSFLGWVIHGIISGKRHYQSFSRPKQKRMLAALLVALPFVLGIYILPTAIAGFSWESIIVWTPAGFQGMVLLLTVALAISYITYFITLIYPETNNFLRMAPGILLMSILAGLANMVIIVLLTSSQDTDIELGYLVFYFGLSFLLYLLGRGIFQKNLVRFTRGLIYDLRSKLIDKIFSTSFQKFEKIDRGRVYTALNDDVDTVGESANMFVMLITSFITAFGAFIYLASIAFWATMLTIFFVVSLCALYYFVSKSSNIYYEKARDSRNHFMRLINGMIDGFKEISLHKKKKLEYKQDVDASSHEYMEKNSIADIQFVNTFLVGESILILLLGSVAFAIPRLFPNIGAASIMSFIIVLLYLGASVNQMVNSVPAILRLRIAWRRIMKFLGEIPATLDLKKDNEPVPLQVRSIRAEGLQFHYKSKNEQDVFSVGPIDLEVKCGEILFIIGGNGSGKTTLAKLLTGLYNADEGKILINDRVVENSELSEYFSVVFNPSFLFERLYSINVKNRQQELSEYLKILNLDEKVRIEENRYSTIDLSGGQRKRLALLQCYLENAPIYLFDEWAADQDPGYRNFFYRTLLPEMKRTGKIVIAITHDDNYFDIADKILKMKDGKLEMYTGDFALTEWSGFTKA